MTADQEGRNSHPQLGELTERVRAFVAGDEDASLSVYEPESYGRVDFLHYGQKGRKHVPVLRTVLIDPDERELAAAERLNIGKGTAISYPLRFGPRSGQIITQVTVRRLITDARGGAQLAIDSLQTLQGASHDAWLWITEEYQFDSWPSPLPKPDVWPPAP